VNRVRLGEASAVATAESPEQSWRWALQFYDGFRGHNWWAVLGPFRQLVVARLAESEWGRRLWASLSHDVLVISRVGGWPERVTRPRVLVIPVEARVRVRRYSAMGEQLGEVELPFAECWPAVVEALTWLEAADAERSDAVPGS
jgi:hypothetical protein